MFSICFFCWPRVPKCWFIRLLGSMILKYHRVSSTVCVLQFWNLCTVFKKQVYAIYINSTNSAKRSGHIAARIVPETCWWLAKVCDRYAPWSGPFNQILMGVYVFFFPVGILLSLCVLEKNLKKTSNLFIQVLFLKVIKACMHHVQSFNLGTFDHSIKTNWFPIHSSAQQQPWTKHFESSLSAYVSKSIYLIGSQTGGLDGYDDAEVEKLHFMKTTELVGNTMWEQ